MARICTVCGAVANPVSWIASQPTCSGHCYRVRLSEVLAARRVEPPKGTKAPPLDRSPVAATVAVSEGYDTFYRVPRKKPAAVKRKKILAGHGFTCSVCREVVNNRGPFTDHDGYLYCTLTCLERAQ